VVVGVINFRASRDVVTLFAAAISGGIPLSFSLYGRARGYWSLLTLLFLLSLVSLVGGDALAEHFLFLCFCALIVFLLNAGHLYLHVGAVEASRRTLPAGYFFSFLVSVGLGTVFGAALFVLFPRSLQWYNPLALRSRESITGYTGQVTLDGNSLQE